ncbi:bifunctional DNA primase/polymerase [Burkholderia seminalis]|uniref:bifunctional DNA primase/polymerase n=1 Tax=Burkholderia seminalis TaxID=488731 RepID=UPI00158DC904|nr:AAA family ATPase [Burkholderia seminalis]
MNMREQALSLAQHRGFNVFPLAPGSKVPPHGSNGYKDATRDAQRIRQAFSTDNFNIGIRCDVCNDTSIFALDIDGPEGEAALADLIAANTPLPSTIESKTRRGRHMIFYAAGPVGNSVSKVGNHIDVRGHNGHIVAPGSTVDGHTYQFIDPHKRIQHAPEWLYKLVRAAGATAEATPIDRAPLPGVDADRAHNRAVAYLKTAPVSVKGQAGDQTAYKVAAKLKDLGCTEAQALDLMLSEHWHDGCGWTPEKLAAKVAHAYKYGQEPAGVHAPEAVFTKSEQPAKPSLPALSVTRVADVQARPIEWLWPRVFALGKHSIIAGQPGLGKSQLSIFLAAAVSVGGTLPDGSKCPQGDVVMLTMEDDIADTIRPRLEAAGADLNRVYVLDGVPEKLKNGQDGLRAFDLTRDVQLLGQLADRLSDLRLIIVDPISAFMGETDSHKNADVRAALSMISKLAESRRAALLSISHLNKSSESNALNRVTGSGAFAAQARAVYIVARDSEDDTLRTMSPAKNNVGDDRMSFFFTVEGVTLDSGISTSKAVWQERTEERSADEALEKKKGRDTDTAVGRAARFIHEQLQGGPKPGKEVQSAAKDMGISEKTLRRAREALGVVTKKAEGSKNGEWLWILPGATAELAGAKTAGDIFD